MDKYEFYKELLSEYTVDKDKIRCNAKRGAKHRSAASVYKWAGMASAAAVALTVGVAALSGLFSGSGVSVTPKTDPEAAAARLLAAEANYVSSVADRDELTGMYVSFSEALSASEALMMFSAISDAGDIKCELLYTADGISYAVGGENADLSGISFAGAKISAPAGYYKDLQDLKAISLVELGIDGISDDNFIPISGDDKATVTVSEAPAITGDVDIVLPDETAAPEVTTGDEISGSSETSEPAVDVNLIASLQIPGAASVSFINNSSFVVISSSTVELYHIGEDGAAVLDTKIYTDSPKLGWSNAAGTSLFITGCDQNGLRKKLYYASGAAGTLSELDVSTITADAELTGLIVCNGDATIIFKTVSLEKSRLYIAARGANLLKTSLAVESECPVSALAYTGGRLYYSSTDTATGAVTVNVKNTETGETTVLATYNTDTKFVKSATFDRFASVRALEDGAKGVEILSGGEMLTAEGATTISFSALNSSIYSDDSGWHCISPAGTVGITESDAAVYSQGPGGSELYIAELGDGAVTIRKK